MRHRRTSFRSVTLSRLSSVRSAGRPEAGDRAPRPGRRLLFFVAKLGLGLIAWLLLWDDNWRRVLRLFSDTRPFYLVPFAAIMIVLIGVSCLK